MKKRQSIDLYATNAVAFVLMALWLYTLADKLHDFETYRHSMMAQVFSKPVALVLLYTLPVTEWLAFCLLLFNRYRRLGLLLSAMLLCAFTLYVGFAVWGLYPKKPCSCGGLFRKLSWNGHLLLNACLSTLSIIGNLTALRSRKEVPGN